MDTQHALKLGVNDFTAFKHIMNPQYHRAAHLDVLDAALSEVVRYLETGQGIQRLIVEAPPRHGKSLTVSQLLPAWVLGRNPWARIILTSYSATLADSNSRAARNYIREPYFQAMFPNVKLADDNAAVNHWSINSPHGVTGSVLAAGLGGSITGVGAHLLIIDDPIRSRAEAESPAMREKIWNAYANDLLSRFNDANRAAQIVMATRWHQSDLTGMIIEREGDRWHRLRLPALAEENDLLGRKPGEALWPARWDEDALQQQRESIGEYAFASLYQQRPVPRGSTVVDTSKIEVVDVMPKIKRRVRAYDLAVTVKKTSDYTVGALVGITHDEDIIILDVWRDKVRAPEMLTRIKQLSRRDGRDTPIVLEGEKSGISQLDYLMEDPEMHGYSMSLQAPIGDKLTRAGAFVTRVEYGRVKMLRGTWNAAAMDEMAVFPAGAHDDQLDAIVAAYNYLADSHIPTVKAVSHGVIYGGR